MRHFSISLLALIGLGGFVYSEEVVYDNLINTRDEIGKEWILKEKPDCKPEIVASPKGGRHFLGKVPQGEQKLVLNKLPKHEFVRIEFDMITVGSWDGSHDDWGPDIWSFRVDDGLPLVESSFCNNAGDLKQSFPDFRYSKRKENKNWTGAKETSSLGYVWVVDDRKVKADAVYHFDFIVPHNKVTMALKFRSDFRDLNTPEPDADQWYGLDNIKVTCLDEHPELTPEQADKAVGNLSSDDAKERYSARVKLIASPQMTVKTIRSRIVEQDNAELNDLVKKLGSESFKEREAATKKLTQIHNKQVGQLRKLRANTTDPEVRERIDHVMGLIKNQVATAVWHDYARVLSVINTDDSEKLMKDFDLKALLR